MLPIRPTFEEYQRYNGKLSEDEFECVIEYAVYTVSSLTFTRSENPPDSMTERVKRCICEIADIRHSYNKAEEMLPRGIASVNNDGLSASKGSFNSSGSDYVAVCRKYLILPVNLMFRGVGRC